MDELQSLQNDQLEQVQLQFVTNFDLRTQKNSSPSQIIFKQQQQPNSLSLKHLHSPICQKPYESLQSQLDPHLQPKLHPLSSPYQNLMQTSIPTSQLTSATTNPTQSQQQLTLKQLDSKYSQPKQQPTSSNLETLKNLPRKIHKNNHIKIQCKTQFPLVRAVALAQFGWTLMSKQSHKELVDIIWTDTYVTEELVNRLRPYQKVNHFPYSTQMGRKDYLFANLNKMKHKHKNDYDYFAKTWIFPQDYQKFKEETEVDSVSQNDKAVSQNDKAFYIAKPVASCQGKGIFLAKRQDILNHTSQNKLLVQEYIQDTLLIDGLKFDTRIYVLVKSLEPLSIYIYKEGLTRLATAKYEQPNQANYRNGRMHLTNYAINKNNPNFVHNKDFRKDNIGHKRSLGSLFEEMQKMGANVTEVKEKINAIIVKTLLAVYQKMTYLERIQHRIPSIRQSIKNVSVVDANEDGLFARQSKPNRPIQNPIMIEHSTYKTETSSKCFELLGFDIMFNTKFEPKLIEINHQPSLTASSPLDYIIKKCLITDVFSLLNIDSKDKENYLSSQRQADPQSSLRGFEVKGARKEITTVNGFGFQAEKQIEVGGFSCIYPVENLELMSIYHRLMPILLIHENPVQTRSKRRQPSFSFYKGTIPAFSSPFRQTKSSLNKKRQQYTCNYINMLGSEKTGASDQDKLKEIGDQNGSNLIMQQKTAEAEISNPEKQTGKRPSLTVRETYGIGKIQPRVKMSKLTEYEMPKKNLNFTIKHMRSNTTNTTNTKSAPKQTADSPQNQSDLPTDKTEQDPDQNTKPRTPYPSARTPSFTKTSKNLGVRIQIASDHSKNMIKDVLNTEPRHSSHDTRIGIRLIKEKQDSIGKIQIMTRGVATPTENSRKHTISLEKYSYPIYQKNETTPITTANNTALETYQSSPTVKPESRSMRRNAEYFDRVYEKELIQRLNKMKTMKEKLQKLKRHSNRSEQEFLVTRQQFRVGKVNDSHKIILPTSGTQETEMSNLLSGPQKRKSNSISIMEPESSQTLESERQQLPFQTIKLMEFEEPQIKKANHNHTQKNQHHHQSRDKVNSSLEMFKDEAFFNSHKKQGVVG